MSQNDNNTELSSAEDTANFPVPYMYVHILTMVAKLILNSHCRGSLTSYSSYVSQDSTEEVC